MYLRRKLIILVCGYLCLSLASCVKSKHPVSEPASAAPYKAAYGTWGRVDADGNRDVIVIGRQETEKGFPQGIMKIAHVKQYANGSLVYRLQLGFATQFEDFGIISLFSESALQHRDENNRPRWDAAQIEEYVLAKFRVEKDRLEVWEIGDVKSAVAAVQSGELPGDIQKERATGQVSGCVITATPEQWQRFFAAGGDKKLFPEQGKRVFSRMTTVP